MEFANIEASSSPPPPLPRRRLNYQPPSPFHHEQPSTDMRSSTRPPPSASPTTGAVEPRSEGVPINQINYAISPSPGRPGQPVQRSHPGACINTAFPTTSCFVDHRQRMALTVVGPEPNDTPAMSPNHSSIHTSDCSTPISPGQPSPLAFQNTPAPELKARKECSQLTIQVYLHSQGSAFNKERGIGDVDTWCKQLQCSMAFHHLRNKLRDQCGHSGYSTLRVEVFEALPSLEKIVNHSMNEREYRGLHECYDHIKRLMQYVKRKMRTTPGFAIPEHVGMAQVSRLKFIKEQMEDIRNGDGGKRRKHRVALKEQLAPAFDDGGGPESTQTMKTTGSNWSFDHIQNSSAQSRPASRYPESSPRSSNISPGAAVPPSPVLFVRQVGSPQQHLKSSPTNGQYLDVNQQHRAVSSTSLDPRLRQRAAMQQDQQQQRLRLCEPQYPEPQHAPDGSDSQRVSAPPNPIGPPRSPAQAYPRPNIGAPVSIPNAGCLAKPYESVLPPILPKSIYRGVAQPYHNMVLVIDSPLWATTAGIGVLKFGYEPDWANGENIQRSGACLEKVTLSKVTGKRWLGDALVECFVGDGSGEVPEWVKEWGADVDGNMLGHGWPGSEGVTDEDFGIKSGTMPGDIIEETTRQLKQLQHLRGRHVDFMDWDWSGLL